MKPMVKGLLIALLVLVLDQIVKYIFLYQIPLAGRPIEVTPFFNLVMVWNPGVSFGLFPAESDAGRWMLIAVAMAIVGYIGWWMRSSEGKLLVLCQGLVIGGAIGNVIDRIIYGAVFDFIDIHVAGYHWPAFNVADATICVGVAGLLLDSILTARHDQSSLDKDESNA